MWISWGYQCPLASWPAWGRTSLTFLLPLRSLFRCCALIFSNLVANKSYYECQLCTLHFIMHSKGHVQCAIMDAVFLSSLSWLHAGWKLRSTFNLLKWQLSICSHLVCVWHFVRYLAVLFKAKCPFCFNYEWQCRRWETFYETVVSFCFCLGCC